MTPEIAWARIAPHLRPGLARYLCAGIKPGSFLCAVIENDLAAAMRRGTAESRNAIVPILDFLDWHADARCYGRAGVIETWWCWRNSDKGASLPFLDQPEFEKVIIVDAGLAPRKGKLHDIA